MEPNKLDRLNQINQYLSGKMDQREREVFEDQSRSDSDLKEALDFSALIVQSERAKDFFEVKNWIDEGIDQSINSKGSSKPGGVLRWTLGIALVGLLTISGIFVYQQRQEAALNRLIAPDLLPLELVLYADDTNDENLQSGFDDYSNEDYTNAINNLETYWSKSKDPNIALYIGVSTLLNKQPEEALLWLDMAQKQIEPPMDEIARWYLCLSYLKMNKQSKAMDLMENWPEDGLYYDRVNRLKEAL